MGSVLKIDISIILSYNQPRLLQNIMFVINAFEVDKKIWKAIVARKICEKFKQF